MDKKLELAASKWLCFVLRHSPESVGLQLDEEGFCEVAQLLPAMHRAGYNLTFPDLVHIVSNDEKDRYSMDCYKCYIRCNQGHSTPMVSIKFDKVEPPEFLYHGTAERFAQSISTVGLHSGSRRYVHLSDNVDTAIDVGRRHARNTASKVIVYQIPAKLMYDQKWTFYRSDNNVWLIDLVPALWLTVHTTL